MRRGQAGRRAQFSDPRDTQPVDYELHLIERRTIESIERENSRRVEDIHNASRHSVEQLVVLLKPFGEDNAEWEALKASVQPDDELWTFASSEATWRALAGSAGIALVREGRIVETLITMRN